MNYFDSEKEVLALLKVFDVGFHYLAGQIITVYNRYSALKWSFQSKSLTGRTVQWATMLSPWNLKIIRCTIVPNTLPALLAASITPYEYFDAVLEDISPSRITSSPALISPFPQITRDFEGYVATFDGAVRTKAPIAGAYSAILWRLPNWDIVYAASFYDLDLTVNDSEYCGLIKVLDIALEHGVNDLILCGDSRIALHQVTGALRCHKPSLAIRMNQAQESVKKINNVRTAHIIRK
jgi:ribonuclease HI